MPRRMPRRSPARWLASGELGYRLVLRHQSKPFLDILSRDDVDSSQRFVDPEIALFERIADAPAHAAPLPPGARPDASRPAAGLAPSTEPPA